MKHNSFFRMLVLLFTLAIMPLAIGQTPGTGASATPDHVTLTWTDDTSKTMTITWRTDPSVASGFVQYQKGDTLSRSAKQVKADSREFVSDLGTARIFSSTLIKLSQDAKYSFRVGYDERWSDVKHFTTGKKKIKSFKFLVASESQSSMAEKEPYGLWRDMVHRMYERNPDARFLMNVGDLVDIGQKGDHWNAWFKAAEGVIDSIPAMSTPGNHETYGSSETTKPLYWMAQFSLPQNGPEGLKSEVYSYDYGNVHFVVLESQAYEQKRQFGDILEPQKKWLDADLAKSRAQWKIVFLHKTPYGVMSTRTNDDVRDAFCPIIDKYHVDIVVSGHDHGVARTFPLKNGVKMEDPSQGTVYFLDGRVGPKSYSTISAQPWDAFFYYPKDQPTYMVFEVKGRKITVTATQQDGTALDTYTIEKK
jgi:acid phosphatase type 7